MVVGRPNFEITDVVCKKANHLAAGGCTVAQIAASLGIGYSTANRKKKQFRKFRESIESGRSDALVSMTNALYEKGLSGDTTAMKFYLINRDVENWREKQHTELSGSVGMHEDYLAELE